MCDGLGCYTEPGSISQVNTRVIETEEIVTLAPISGGIVSYVFSFSLSRAHMLQAEMEALRALGINTLAYFWRHFFPSLVLMALFCQGHRPCWRHDIFGDLIVSHVYGRLNFDKAEGVG